ncbi:hypothetical protein Ndes2526B_g01334 [Nannochloris sp. 'desiccata']
MGFLDDPVTADFASRNELEEEEEAAIINEFSKQYKVKPSVDLDAANRSPGTLLILTGPAASLTLDAAFGPTQQVGSVSVPELCRLRSPLQEELGVEQNPPHIFTLLKPDDNSSTLIATSRRPLPAEQASLWAETVIAEVAPSSTFIVSSILSMEYRGPGDAAEDNLIFKLQNTKAIQDEKENSKHVASLPEGTLLAGIPAAVLEVCEDGNRPATALVAVESSPVPEVSLVSALADAVCIFLGRKKVDAAGKVAVAAAVDGVYQSSASNSMFI